MAQQTGLDAYAENSKASEDTEAPARPDKYEDWTPKQQENWENYGAEWFQNIESEDARELFLETYRPKKRGDGLMDRDQVKTNGHRDAYYVKKSLEDLKNPMGSMRGIMMAQMLASEEAQELTEEIEQAYIASLSEAEQKRLAKSTARVAELYGVMG